jgi:hypothetical protein
VKELYGAEHYRLMGEESGQKTMQTRDKVHFSAIGKVGGTNKASNALKRKHATT